MKYRKHKVINQIPIVTNKTSSRTLDINVYGPVVDSSWWDDGVTTPQQVQDALKSASNVDQINVHINSPGGSVFAGQAIHNMLKQHPANVTVYIDGLAASIASVIAMAGDKIVMPPGTMMMIHNPLLSIWGSYQSADMREMADFLDKVKESLVATYVSRQTKKTKDEIVALMDATTWLTASDAVDMGFADEVEGGTVSASMAGNVLNIAGMAFDLSPFASMPLNIMPAAVQTSVVPTKTKNKEETILDLNELKAKYPDLYNEVLNLGVTQERSRMKALDEIQLPGHDALINKARFETGATAEQVAMEIIAAEKAIRNKTLSDLADDAIDAGKVPPATPPADDAAELQAIAKQIADSANRRRG